MSNTTHEPNVSKKTEISNRSKEIIAGLAAGLATTLITHPLDLFKVRLQLDTQSKTTWEGIRTIIKDIDSNVAQQQANNPQSSARLNLVLKDIYRGIFPNLVGNVTAWGFYFMSYREFKNLSYTYLTSNPLQGNSHGKSDLQLNSGHYLVSSFAAGLSTSLLTNPIWVLKTRILSTNKNHPGAYQSLLDGVRRIAKEEGIFAFWKGLTPSLFGVLQSALQFTIYDTLKYHIVHRFNTHSATDDDSKLTTLQYIYTSATSKMISTTMLYPAQVVKSRLQGYSNRSSDTSMRELSTSIFAKEGLRGFYKGLIPNLIRVVPATCITFVVYEKTRDWL